MAMILSPIVLSWSQEFAWSTDEMAVEKWLGVIPYDSNLFDTPLPEYEILHKTASAGNTISR